MKLLSALSAITLLTSISILATVEKDYRPKEFELVRMTGPHAIEAFQKKIVQAVEQGKFSGSILVAKNGEVIFSHAYGFTDYSKQILNQVDTKFNLGSMNKMFTAVAIAQLAQAGKLNFLDSLIKYIPDYPNPEFAQVTIHQLLTHTGGTGDVFGPEFYANIEKLKGIKDYLNLYGKRFLEFRPGSECRYSNYGYVLLGAIIEQVSGQNYYDYIQQHIYDSTGMIDSGSFWKNQETPNLAIGYTLKDGVLKNNYDLLPIRGLPAGGGYSTVEDLLKFSQALIDNKLLNADYTSLVTTGKVKMNHGQYAYGFGNDMQNGLRRIGHNGGYPGINSVLAIYPSSRYVVIVMSNFDVPVADSIAEFIGSRLPS